MSDFTFIWLIVNLSFALQFAYQQKSDVIDQIIEMINERIDENLQKVPYIKKIEEKNKIQKRKL